MRTVDPPGGRRGEGSDAVKVQGCCVLRAIPDFWGVAASSKRGSGRQGRGYEPSRIARPERGALRVEDHISAGARSRSRLRASDSDRGRVLDMLKAAFVQGRLTKQEFDARVDQTLLARTLGDLTALTADILPWPIPPPVRKPAKTPSPPAPAIGKAVACAIIGVATIAIAAMPAIRATLVPRHMKVAACHAFYDWVGDHRDVSDLNRALNDAQEGSDSARAAELTHLRQAYLRYERLSASQQSAASLPFLANHVRAYTSRVVSGCHAPGR